MPTDVADPQAATPPAAAAEASAPASAPVNPFAEFAELLKGYGDPRAAAPAFPPVSRGTAEVVFAAGSTGSQPNPVGASAEDSPVVSPAPIFDDRRAPRNAGRLLSDRLAASEPPLNAPIAPAPPESRSLLARFASRFLHVEVENHAPGGPASPSDDGGVDEVHVTLNIGRRR